MDAFAGSAYSSRNPIRQRLCAAPAAIEEQQQSLALLGAGPHLRAADELGAGGGNPAGQKRRGVGVELGPDDPTFDLVAHLLLLVLGIAAARPARPAS